MRPNTNTPAVCVVVQNIYDDDVRVRRKAQALAENNFKVDVIALEPLQKKGSAPYSLEGVTVYTIPLKKKRASRLRYLYEYSLFFFLSFIKLSFLTFKNRYTIIDVNTLPDFLVFVSIIPKLMGATVIVDMHEIMPEFYMSKYNIDRTHWIIRLLRFQEKLSIRYADYVFTVNEPYFGSWVMVLNAKTCNTLLGETTSPLR